jgi:hypothetical protein
MSAPEIRSSAADEATIDEPVTIEVPVSFWQRPFAQNVVPLCTSLALHAGVIVMGIATYQVVTRIQARTVDQKVAAATEIMAASTDLESLHPGPKGDPKRKFLQDLDPDVTELDGISKVQSRNLSETLAGGPLGAASFGDDLALSVTPSIPGGGRGGPGHGPGESASGTGGRMAPFGWPGGGDGSLPKGTRIFKGGARKIVFVLDATGSMMPSFDSLRVQIRSALQNMVPPQSFNIVFINENNPRPLSTALLFVTPENKRKAFDYVDAMAPRGRTDPLPALEKAFAQQPELIFLLMDPGDIPDKKAMLDLVISKAAGGKIKMNVIGFESHDAENEAFLKSLADSTGGHYSYVSKEDLLNP